MFRQEKFEQVEVIDDEMTEDKVRRRYNSQFLAFYDKHT